MGADLPGLTVPTLAVHGSADPIAAPGAVRAYAEQTDALQYREFAGARHGVLDDTDHREVAAAVIDFVAQHS
jgi:alpha-beta hydrolase superfamily lysophospholipase